MNHDVMRAKYRTLSAEEQARLNRIKFLGEELYNAVVEAGSNRELSIARSKIEEAVMWASKGVTAPIV